MKNTCQSCGQPLKDNNKGTEKDGLLSAEYCKLCYDKGAFKEPNMTIEQMKERYIEAMQNMHFPRFIAGFFANKQLPKLKRWSN
jgi:hypothetical protein